MKEWMGLQMVRYMAHFKTGGMHLNCLKSALHQMFDDNLHLYTCSTSAYACTHSGVVQWPKLQALRRHS